MYRPYKLSKHVAPILAMFVKWSTLYPGTILIKHPYQPTHLTTYPSTHLLTYPPTHLHDLYTYLPTAKLVVCELLLF